VAREAISRTNLKSMLKHTAGKFFNVKFLKKDGSKRSLTGRLGVTSHLKGGENKVEALKSLNKLFI
jgi:hypothetical protein